MGSHLSGAQLTCAAMSLRRHSSARAEKHLGDRESSRPELPFEIVAVERVRRPVAALAAHDVLARLFVHSGERVELIDARER